MQTQGLRQKKVGRLLEKMLNEYFRAKASDVYHNAIITVTQVWLPPDLRMARIYLSIFGLNIDKKIIFNQIVEETTSLRGEVGKQLGKQLQFTPELFFKLDDSLDEMAKIDQLLS